MFTNAEQLAPEKLQSCFCSMCRFPRCKCSTVADCKLSRAGSSRLRRTPARDLKVNNTTIKVSEEHMGVICMVLRQRRAFVLMIQCIEAIKEDGNFDFTLEILLAKA